jgi:hypothetical protein
MSKEVTTMFQNLFCEDCGRKVLVSKGEGYWRVDPSFRPWRVLAWHTDCRFGENNGPGDATGAVDNEGPMGYPQDANVL